MTKINSVESNKQRRKRIKSEGAEKLYEDKKWLLVRLFTIEASSLYGGHTKWCTVRHINTTIDTLHKHFFKGYVMSGGLYYIIDKTKYARKDRYGKLSIHKNWEGIEVWTDPTDHDLTEHELKEVKKYVKPELINLILKNWTKIKPIKYQPVRFNPLTIIKSYYNKNLSNHLSLVLIKYEHNLKVNIWVMITCILISLPILPLVYLFRGK